MEALRVVINQRPWTVNGERKMHLHKRAKLTREFRQEAAFQCAGHSGLRTPVDIEVIPYLKGKRKQDTGAQYPAVKAVIDGLVDADAIPGDGPEYIRSITMHRPVTEWEGDALLLLIHTCGRTVEEPGGLPRPPH